MPRGDRTGPDGMGPRTGRGMGYCAGYDSPGFTKGVSRGGAGFGRGFGRGRGFRFWRQPTPVQPQPFYGYSEPVTLTKEEQKKILEEERKAIQEELKTLEEKIKELEK